MTKNSAFDDIAARYDDTCTGTSIGTLQRRKVYHFLEPIILTLKGVKILDLGCGTGEDVSRFAKKNFLGVNMDNSSAVMQIANQKKKIHHLESKTVCYQLSITELEKLPEDEKFDLIFSNFGAFNCLNPSLYNQIAQRLKDRLQPEGHQVAVVLTKFCLWESFYFIIKRKRFSKAGILAPLTPEVHIKNWYVGSTEFYSFFSPYFTKQTVAPISFFVPPSYITWFDKKNLSSYLRFLNKLDQKNPFQTICSHASDHFIIHMTRK